MATCMIPPSLLAKPSPCILCTNAPFVLCEACARCNCGQHRWGFICPGPFMGAPFKCASGLKRGVLLLGMWVVCFRVVQLYGCVFLHVFRTRVHLRAAPLIGIFTPSDCVVLLFVPHCNTAHLSVCRSRIKNFPRIVCHPAPPVFAQTPSRSKPSAFSMTFAPETPNKNGVSIGPMFLQSRLMRVGQPIPRVAVVLDYRHIIPAEVFATPLWGIPIAPRRNHLSHVMCAVARHHCNVVRRPWRHIVEVSHPPCQRMSVLMLEPPSARTPVAVG
jgi:hypothetical protein